MKIYLILFAILFGTYDSMACSCSSYIDEFCHAADSSDNIALIEILDMPDPTWANFKVIENINKDIANDTIEVVGQDGLNCGIDLSQFEPGDTLVVNLQATNYTNAYNGLEFNWIFNDCWRTYLHYSNGSVIGPVTTDITDQDYETFKQDILTCFDFSLSSKVVLNVDIEVFPNPAVNNVFIKSRNIQFENISIFDSSGHLISEVKNINAHFDTFSIDHLQSGIYFILINSPEGIIRKKIIKMEG